LGGRGRRISEFEARLVYKVSSRALQRNPVSKNQKKKKRKKEKEKETASIRPSLLNIQDKNTVRREEVSPTTTVAKPWQGECEVLGHTASTVRKT
jgi:hypothetical protein